MTRESRRFFLDQHGCAKNQVDGELIIQHLSDMGWSRCDDASEASLIIINSCGFIESAKVESINSLMDARNAYPNSKIILAGCLAERYAEDFVENLPEADAIFGNGDISKIKDLVQNLFPDKEGKTAAAVEASSACPLKRLLMRPPQEGISAGPRSEFLNYPSSAYLKITEGCSNCCSFCAIPLIRGSLRSRSIADIVSELKELLAKGIFEINLIGQDLAAFGRDGVTPGDSGNQAYFKEPSPLAELLRSISALPGKFWVRLLYIHPDHFPFDIIPLLKADNRLLPYFDIPFQSGSNSVLKAMNRSATAETYLNIVAKLRSELDAVIRTTFLCGFPGETEENAGETESFLERVEVDWCGCFAYSREDDTPAYSLKKQVPVAKAEARTKRLLSKQESITEKQLRKRVGKIYDVLIEEVIETQEEEGGLALGRAWFQAPDVDGTCVIRYDLDDKKACEEVRVGNVVAVKVLAVNGVDLDTLYLPQGKEA